MELIQNIIRGVEDTDSDKLEILLGTSSLDALTEKTSEVHEKTLAGTAADLEKFKPQSLTSCDAQMPTRIKQRYDALKAAVGNNKVVAGSTVGNLFRGALTTDAALAQK